MQKVTILMENPKMWRNREVIEMTHNPQFHKKIHRNAAKTTYEYTNTKRQDGNLLHEWELILERWAQYVE